MIKTKSIITFLVLCLLFSSIPNRAETENVTASLSFSGTTATCFAKIKKAGKTISATMELWHGTTLIDSWSGTGSSSLILNETHSGCVSGWTYTLKINGTINGVAFPEISVTETC